MEPIENNVEDVGGFTGHILFFEPRAGGHRAEFIQYLLEHISDEGSGPEWKYTFAISETLCRNHVELVRLAESSENVSLLSIGGSGSSHWETCCECIDRFSPTHLMLMELTPFELPLCFSRFSCRVSGILFVQYPELRFGTWRQRLKFAIKQLKTSLFLRNSQIHRIFLLNGDSS